jgi:hypothetical protein
LLLVVRPVQQPQQLELTVKAEEDEDDEEGELRVGNGRRLSTSARLIITVKPVDAHVPRIVSSSSSFEGIVEENSPEGTAVTSLSRRDSMQSMKLRVIDDDLQVTKTNRLMDSSTRLCTNK